MCACVHVCMCACVHVCMCACVCMRVHACACVCMRVHACVSACVSACARACASACASASKVVVAEPEEGREGGVGREEQGFCVQGYSGLVHLNCHQKRNSARAGVTRRCPPLHPPPVFDKLPHCPAMWSGMHLEGGLEPGAWWEWVRPVDKRTGCETSSMTRSRETRECGARNKDSQ